MKLNSRYFPSVNDRRDMLVARLRERKRTRVILRVVDARAAALVLESHDLRARLDGLARVIRTLRRGLAKASPQSRPDRTDR